MSSAYGTRYENRYCLAMKDLLYGLSKDQYTNPQSVFNLMLTRKLHFLSVSNRNLHVLITGAELKIFIERQLEGYLRNFCQIFARFLPDLHFKTNCVDRFS